MLKKVLVTLGLLFLLILSGKATETIVPRLSPLPATIQGQKISLNGEWYFHPSLKSGFNGTEDVKNWNTIQVPGEWVMQGFEVKKGKPPDMSGISPYLPHGKVNVSSYVAMLCTVIAKCSSTEKKPVPI